jgi:hypothetical protein
VSGHHVLMTKTWEVNEAATQGMPAPQLHITPGSLAHASSLEKAGSPLSCGCGFSHRVEFVGFLLSSTHLAFPEHLLSIRH